MKSYRGFVYSIIEDNGEKYCEAKNETNIVLRFIIGNKDEKYIEKYIDNFIDNGLSRVYMDETLVKEEYN